MKTKSFAIFALAILILFSSTVYSSDHCLDRPTEGFDAECGLGAEAYLLGFVGVLALAFIGFVVYMAPRRKRNAADLDADLDKIEQLRKAGLITEEQAKEDAARARSKSSRNTSSK